MIYDPGLHAANISKKSGQVPCHSYFSKACLLYCYDVGLTVGTSSQQQIGNRLCGKPPANAGVSLRTPQREARRIVAHSILQALIAAPDLQSPALTPRQALTALRAHVIARNPPTPDPLYSRRAPALSQDPRDPPHARSPGPPLRCRRHRARARRLPASSREWLQRPDGGAASCCWDALHAFRPRRGDGGLHARARHVGGGPLDRRAVDRLPPRLLRVLAPPRPDARRAAEPSRLKTFRFPKH
jgi:hypothetical protein